MSTILVVVRLLLSTASMADRSESGWTTMTLTGLCSLTVGRTGGQRRTPNKPKSTVWPSHAEREATERKW